ncbi:MAG: iron donor protein CyaY [Janthinobacterium lividum]
MDDTEFSKLSKQTLFNIVTIIEEIDKQCSIDIDFDSEIINLDTKDGVFVINKHSAAKEIWLASPISGPYHFSYNNGNWCSKYGIDLFEILEQELNIKFNERDI